MWYVDMAARAGATSPARSARWPASPSRSSPRSPGTPSAAAASSRWPATGGSPPTTPSSASPRSSSGIIPGAGGTQRLARLVGPARAKDIIMSGRIVDAEEALRIGLADRVVPAAEVYDDGGRAGPPYTTGPAQALRAAKLAIDGGLEMDLTSGLAWESQLFAALFATEDRGEGMAAFVEKRKPDFTGPITAIGRRQGRRKGGRIRLAAMSAAAVRLGVDFGTSQHRRGAALRPTAGRGRCWSTGRRCCRRPSTREPDGALVVGRDAVHSARLDPARFEPNPKRRIDDGSVLLGDREVPVVDLVDRGARAGRRRSGGACTGGGVTAALTLTCPAVLGRDPPRPARPTPPPGRPRRRAGWCAEPVAAATYFAEVLGRDVPIGVGVVVLRLRGRHVRRERGGAPGGRVRGARGRRARRHRRARRRRGARRATSRSCAPSAHPAAWQRLATPGDGRRPPGAAAAVGRRTGGEGAAVAQPDGRPGGAAARPRRAPDPRGAGGAGAAGAGADRAA